VLDAELADVFRRICWLVPNDPGHSGLYSRCARSIVQRLVGFPFPGQFKKKPSMESPPEGGQAGGADREASTICSGLIGAMLNSAPNGESASATALAVAAGVGRQRSEIALPRGSQAADKSYCRARKPRSASLKAAGF
jgi:hypothetical protein